MLFVRIFYDNRNGTWRARPLDWVHIWLLCVTNDAVNIVAHTGTTRTCVSCPYWLHFCWFYTQKQIAGCHSSFVLDLLWNQHFVFTNGCVALHPQCCIQVLFFSTSLLPVTITSTVLIITDSNRSEVKPHCGFHLNFLMTSKHFHKPIGNSCLLWTKVRLGVLTFFNLVSRLFSWYWVGWLPYVSWLLSSFQVNGLYIPSLTLLAVSLADWHIGCEKTLLLGAIQLFLLSYCFPFCC